MGEDTLKSLRDLLSKIELLRFKHEKVLSADRTKFNVFSILRKTRDEVFLHSRFLAELLDPDGTHQQKVSFLRSFLETVGISGFSIESVKVFREKYRIDILIENKNKQVVIIENKIDAKDQEEQLSNYVRTIKKRGIEDVWIVYLTLDRHHPHENSLPVESRVELENINKYFAISYDDEIRVWLDCCIKESASFPTLRETLVQYRELVDKLTGNTLSQGYLMEIKELLINDSKSFLAALDLEKSLVGAKVELQWLFWDELQKVINKKGIELCDSIVREDVKNFYVKQKNRKDFFLSCEILNGAGMVAIDGYFDMGYCHPDDTTKSSDAKFKKWVSSELIISLDKEFPLNERKSSGDWPWYIDLGGYLNFEAIGENEMRLLDKNEREKIVESIASEFIKLIDIAKKHKKTFG
jgi:hypothetical protein